jgi:4-hydroxy-2-oxoheptanedioate aldolase
MPTPIRTLLAEGKPVVNGWVQIPAPFSAESLGRAGFDSITMDMQHGLMDYATVVTCLQAIHRFPITPLVRVPWNEPGIIGRVLDAGSMGVICPMVNTKAEAEALVRAVRFPPMGARSHGPIRAGTYGEAGTYYKTANTDVLCIPMIETPEAISNIDAILSVPGIDGIYIGPGDLGLAMGLAPMLDRREPEVLAHYKTLIAACKKHKVFAGLHNGTAAYAAEMIKMGFRFVTLSSDVGIMVAAATAEVKVAKAGGK